MKIKKKKNAKYVFTPFPVNLYQKGQDVENCIFLPLAVCLGVDDYFKDKK